MPVYVVFEILGKQSVLFVSLLAVLVVLTVTNICTLHCRILTIFKTSGHMGLFRVLSFSPGNNIGPS